MADDALLPGAAPRFQIVMPLYVDRLEPLVIDTLRAPFELGVALPDVSAGTVNEMLVSDQLVTVTPVTVEPAAFVSVTEPVPWVAPKPLPVTVTVRPVPVGRTYGWSTASSCGSVTPRSQRAGFDAVVPGASTVAAAWVGAVSVTV